MRIVRVDQCQRANVEQVFYRAFADAEGSAEGEAIRDLVRTLIDTTDQYRTQGFVALNEADLPVGGIFFTPLTFANPAAVMMLSPVAVATDYQGQGVGERLIREGLDALTRQGIQMAVTYGDPQYYGRFGFQGVSVATVPPPHELAQPEGWQAVPLGNAARPDVQGPSRCIPPFDKPALW